MKWLKSIAWTVTVSTIIGGFLCLAAIASEGAKITANKELAEAQQHKDQMGFLALELFKILKNLLMGIDECVNNWKNPSHLLALGFLHANWIDHIPKMPNPFNYIANGNETKCAPKSNESNCC